MLLALGDAGVDGLKIFDLKLGVDDLLVADGVDRSVDVGDIIVVEATKDVDYGVGLADVGEELVAETLAFACSLDETCDVDNLDSCGDDLRRVLDFVEYLETVVGDGDDADVRFDGAEGEVGRLGLGVGEAVEEGRLADVGQAYDAALESHVCLIMNILNTIGKRGQRMTAPPIRDMALW